MVALSNKNHHHLQKIYQNCYYENIVYFKANDILAGEISNSRFFPMFMPNSKQVVSATIERFKSQIGQIDDFFNIKADENTSLLQQCCP